MVAAGRWALGAGRGGPWRGRESVLRYDPSSAPAPPKSRERRISALGRGHRKSMEATTVTSSQDVDSWIEQLKKMEKMDEQSIQKLCEMAKSLFDAEANVLPLSDPTLSSLGPAPLLPVPYFSSLDTFHIFSYFYLFCIWLH